MDTQYVHTLLAQLSHHLVNKGVAFGCQVSVLKSRSDIAPHIRTLLCIAELGTLTCKGTGSLAIGIFEGRDTKVVDSLTNDVTGSFELGVLSNEMWH